MYTLFSNPDGGKKPDKWTKPSVLKTLAAPCYDVERFRVNNLLPLDISWQSIGVIGLNNSKNPNYHIIQQDFTDIQQRGNRWITQNVWQAWGWTEKSI